MTVIQNAQVAGSVPSQAPRVEQTIQYDPISASLSLMQDSSLEVRRGAAAYIAEIARDFRELPCELIETLLNERDSAVVTSIMSAIPRMCCPVERSVPALIYLLSDPRREVSLTAARALGELGDVARGAYVPMIVLDRGSPVGARDPRVVVFESHLSEDCRDVYSDAAVRIDMIRGAGRRALQTDLRHARTADVTALNELSPEALAFSMCLGSEYIRSLASSVWIKWSNIMEDRASFVSLVEGALAFVAPEIQRGEHSDAAIDSFFEACRETRAHGGLEFVIASLNLGNNVLAESLKDFTTVYLAEAALLDATVCRMCDELLSSDPRMTLALATNLGTLAHRLPEPLTSRVIDALFTTLVSRVAEGEKVSSALERGILSMSEFCEDVVTRCEQLVSSGIGSTTRDSIARILSRMRTDNSDINRRRDVLLRYLSTQTDHW